MAKSVRKATLHSPVPKATIGKWNSEPDRLGAGERLVGGVVFAVGEEDELAGARRVVDAGQDIADSLEGFAQRGAAAADAAELLDRAEDIVHVVGANALREQVGLIVEGDESEQVLGAEAFDHFLHDVARHLATAGNIGDDALRGLTLRGRMTHLLRVRIAAHEDIHRFGDINQQDQVRRNRDRRRRRPAPRGDAAERRGVRLDGQERVDIAGRVLFEERPVQFPTQGESIRHGRLSQVCRLRLSARVTPCEH